ncbi:hypothetical protein B0H10DRAFT_1963768 [Mycena sp. CBHHK59/15]|nr:hypothetical protein B0H10DRAFT_1963768 [Mycena sp. CBHHK59/15]
MAFRSLCCYNTDCRISLAQNIVTNRLPHPTTCKTDHDYWLWGGSLGGLDLAGIWTGTRCSHHSAPNDAQNTQVLQVFLVVRWVGGFGGDLHWNSMYGSFRTQQRAKHQSPSHFSGRSLGGWIWQGFPQELDVRVLPHPTTRKTLKAFKCVWSFAGWLNDDTNGAVHKKSTQERPECLPWGIRGETNIHSGDIIWEKRHMQMAEKRALLKAKHRASDKPRPKKGRLVQGKGTVSPDNDQQPEDSGLSDDGVGGPSVNVPHDNEARILADAENAPESPFQNWRNEETIEEEVRSDDEVESDDDEHEPGVRSISQVAHEAANHNSDDVAIDQDAERDKQRALQAVSKAALHDAVRQSQSKPRAPMADAQFHRLSR